MTSKTVQKHDARKGIHMLMVAEFQAEDTAGREALFRGVLARLTSRMTLPELREWHDLILSKRGSQ